MTTGIVHDQNFEKQIKKQMGCMAGFFQIFDRHQLLTGKRLYATKRLPPSPAVESASGSDSELWGELEKQPQPISMATPERSKPFPASPSPETSTPVHNPTRSPLPLPIFEMKEHTRSWKLSKEAPRLSLDSRAIMDAKGSLCPREIRTNAAILSANRCSNPDGASDDDKQHHSPSVIARLMGLEPLTRSYPEAAKKVELRRSASESRVSRDFQYRSTDCTVNGFQQKMQNQLNSGSSTSSNMKRDNAAGEYHWSTNARPVDRSMKTEPARPVNRYLGHKKSFFDSQDFFPEPKQTVPFYGEIEKRLKIRGIDEPSKDLETLKQILDALQLKGLLHSKKPSNQVNNRSRGYSGNEPPIVVMKPTRGPVRPSRVGNDSPPSSYRARNGACRSPIGADNSTSSMSPRRDRTEMDRNARRGRSMGSPVRSESGVDSPNRRRQLSVESPRRVSESTEQRKGSPVHSPKVSSGRSNTNNRVAKNQSPRNRRSASETENYSREEKAFTPAEDESSTLSESSFSTSSYTETERSKVEDYKEGRSLLERCDKLLHSIAEITESELQPSPVSVLDSFYKEEESPSPVMKRSTDFKDQLVDLDADMWTSAASLPVVDMKAVAKFDDCDFLYISDILQALSFFPDREDLDIFLLLEKQQYVKGNDTSKLSGLQRRLIFDTINEILDKKRQSAGWKAISHTNYRNGEQSLQQIWSEFERMRERDASEELFEVICGMLKKDMAGDTSKGWGDGPIETSDLVLDMERLIFKDLIGETIGDLAAAASSANYYHTISTLCRKLVF